jgi:hypothetical protein
LQGIPLFGRTPCAPTAMEPEPSERPVVSDNGRLITVGAHGVRPR